MSPESSKKKPELVDATGGAAPDPNTPERVRKPHYDWEHESQADLDLPHRVKGAARMSLWKENVEAWIRRYLLLGDVAIRGGRDDDFNAA